AEVVERVLELDDRLLQVDDVDLVPVAEDVWRHPGIPEAGLVTEMDTRLQHLSHRDRHVCELRKQTGCDLRRTAAWQLHQARRLEPGPGPGVSPLACLLRTAPVNDWRAGSPGPSPRRPGGPGLRPPGTPGTICRQARPGVRSIRGNRRTGANRHTPEQGPRLTATAKLRSTVNL